MKAWLNWSSASLEKSDFKGKFNTRRYKTSSTCSTVSIGSECSWIKTRSMKEKISYSDRFFRKLHFEIFNLNWLNCWFTNTSFMVLLTHPECGVNQQRPSIRSLKSFESRKISFQETTFDLAYIDRFCEDIFNGEKIMSKCCSELSKNLRSTVTNRNLLVLQLSPRSERYNFALPGKGLFANSLESLLR